MQLSNVISDLVLFSIAMASWGFGFSRLPKPLSVLWGCFLIPVAIAALSGAGRFADLHPMMLTISELFQQVSSTMGACCLVVGAFLLVQPEQSLSYSATIAWIAVVFGAALFLAARFGGIQSIVKFSPPIAMLGLVFVGVAQLLKGNHKRLRFQGVSLILGVILSGLAIVSLASFARPLSIDLYHYLLAVSFLSFAVAGRLAKQNS
ncbi:MAG: hypothetical protein U0930_22620 [Pirellulales bacterium]